MWGQLHGIGIAESTILWNALPLHPHPMDNVLKNRTPRRDELALGQGALRLLVEAFPHAMVVAVGRKAEAALTAAGITYSGVRHPANGGATTFRDQLEHLLTSA
jgi:uracil-DNA glycosylase